MMKRIGKTAKNVCEDTKFMPFTACFLACFIIGHYATVYIDTCVIVLKNGCTCTGSAMKPHNSFYIVESVHAL